LQVVEISELGPFVHLQLTELEPVLILALIDSSIKYNCDLYCDSSLCSPCANMNQFLITDCANCDVGSNMDISAELLELEL